MPSPSARTLSAGTAHAAGKRRRDFTAAERRHMIDSKNEKFAAKSLRRSSLASARAASAASSRAARHEAHVIEQARSALPPVHGAHKFITEEQSQAVIRLLITAYDVLCPDSHWLAKAVPAVAKNAGISDVMVREIWSYFSDRGQFYQTERPVPPKSAEAVELDSQAREFLESELPRCALKGISHNTHSLQLLLLEHFGVGFSSYHVKHMMAEMGYTFGKMSQDWTVGLTSPRRQRQLLLHLLMLNQALEEVKAGTAVLLFTDQTFIDTRTHNRYGYFHPEKTRAHFPKGTGLRVAHMHALTADGLLAVTGPDGKPVIPPSSDGVRGARASEPAPTAELTFSLKPDQGAPESSGPEREKKGFSAKVCAEWVQNRLIPAARLVWPKPMKLYLYMDNFSGHTGRGKDMFWPRAGKGHTREWNLRNLKAAGCASLVHNGVEYAIDDLLSSSKPAGGPNADVIISLGRDWMWRNCPENAYSAVQHAAMSDGNLTIIFSVPLTPDANPIEYWWGSSKGALARLWDGDVDPGTIIERWRAVATEQGMVMEGGGGLAGHPKANPRCQGYVDVAIRWADEHLVPLSALAMCGKLGSFDLSKVEGAAALCDSMVSHPGAYYRVWRECESLSLVPADAEAVAGDDEEVED